MLRWERERPLWEPLCTRFAPGGRFAEFRFSPEANQSDVERRVRDRYLTLAASNDDHFVAPGTSDAATGSGFGSAVSAYRRLHEIALDEAWRLGLQGEDVSRAMAREAAAQHYLTDAFAAGHSGRPLPTSVGTGRRAIRPSGSTCNARWRATPPGHCAISACW